jgi:hypothetical protein
MEQLKAILITRYWQHESGVNKESIIMSMHSSLDSDNTIIDLSILCLSHRSSSSY